jgi:hypothetical protein
MVLSDTSVLITKEYSLKNSSDTMPSLHLSFQNRIAAPSPGLHLLIPPKMVRRLHTSRHQKDPTLPAAWGMTFSYEHVQINKISNSEKRS